MRPLRGVTLLELMITLVVSSIALAGAVLASRTQERAYYTGQKLRSAQHSARQALLFLEQKLMLAGYGLDAPLALDFGWYDPAAVGTCPPAVSPCARDRIDDADEIVFYGRNPAYWVDPVDPLNTEPRGKAWSVTGVSGNLLSVKARAGDVFRRGQIVQVVCAGTLSYAYATVDQTVTAPADGTQELTLGPTVVADPFQRTDVLPALPCVATPSPTAKAFLVDRYRFHVRPEDMGGGRWDPYLALDTGTDTDLDGDVDVDDELLIAEGIESLQVAWFFADPAIPVAGNVSGTPVAIVDPATAPPNQAPQTIVRTLFPGPAGAGGSVYAASSFYQYSLLKLPPQRQTNAQGNIRRALVTLVARSPEPDPTGPSNLRYDANSQVWGLNQTIAPAWVTSASVPRGDDGFQRAVVQTGVNLPNMTNRTMIYY